MYMYTKFLSFLKGAGNFFASFVPKGKTYGEKETKEYRQLPDSLNSSWRKDW